MVTQAKTVAIERHQIVFLHRRVLSGVAFPEKVIEVSLCETWCSSSDWAQSPLIDRPFLCSGSHPISSRVGIPGARYTN